MSTGAEGDPVLLAAARRPGDGTPGGPVIASFVVIAHNEAAAIERALRSILVQPVAKEVIVVDDGSADETAAIVGRLADSEPDLRLLRLDRNRGRGFARSAGVRQARGRYIATVDADIVLPVDWWERCLNELRDADAVGGIAVPDGDVSYLCARLGLKARAKRHTTPVTGSNGVFRREIFERLSFDESLRDGEDVALGHALVALGARARAIPELVVSHLDSRGFMATVNWLFQSGRGATRQLLRYRQIRGPDMAFAGWLASLGYAAALARRRPAARATPLSFLLGVATVHTLRVVEFDRRTARRLPAAVALDAVLLAAYFGGRLSGLWLAVRREGRS